MFRDNGLKKGKTSAERWIQLQLTVSATRYCTLAAVKWVFFCANPFDCGMLRKKRKENNLLPEDYVRSMWIYVRVRSRARAFVEKRVNLSRCKRRTLQWQDGNEQRRNAKRQPARPANFLGNDCCVRESFLARSVAQHNSCCMTINVRSSSPPREFPFYCFHWYFLLQRIIFIVVARKI